MVAVKSEKELLELLKKARGLRILTTIIRDDGKIQVDPILLLVVDLTPIPLL